MARLLKEVVFEGAAWGCLAERDPVSWRFCYPLTITGVRPNSEAAAFSLRAGDQIVSWSKKESGAPDYKDVMSTESIERSTMSLYRRPSYYVDEETQQMLCQGGACRMRVRPVPRCSTPRCLGTIMENADSFDHSLVCDECGVQEVSTCFRFRLRFRFRVRFRVRCARARTLCCCFLPECTAHLYFPVCVCKCMCPNVVQTSALIKNDSGRRLAHL